MTFEILSMKSAMLIQLWMAAGFAIFALGYRRSRWRQFHTWLAVICSEIIVAYLIKTVDNIERPWLPIITVAMLGMNLSLLILVVESEEQKVKSEVERATSARDTSAELVALLSARLAVNSDMLGASPISPTAQAALVNGPRC